MDLQKIYENQKICDNTFKNIAMEKTTLLQKYHNDIEVLNNIHKQTVDKKTELHMQMSKHFNLI
jgi:phosphoribosylaminoimidazole-succinocarboxamide synthase